MIITSELAQPIIEQITKVMGHNINIMNHEGVIVASSDRTRLNQVHQGAIEVMKLKTERVIYATESHHLKGTKPGVNLPIWFHKECIGTVGITGNPEEVYTIASVAKITVEALLQQNYLSDQLRFKRKTIEEWAIDLINPHYHNWVDLEERAQFLKIDTSKTCSFFLIEIGELMNNQIMFEEISVKQEEILHLLEPFTPTFLTFTKRDQLVMAIPANSSNSKEGSIQLGHRMKEKLHHKYQHITIGIGNPEQKALGYRTSYLQSLQSLRLIKKLTHPIDIMHINDWGFTKILDAITSEEQKVYLNEYPFLRDVLQDIELKETLETFLHSDLSIEQTAKQLNVHRNTVTYRLDKIKNLCGLNPRRFRDAVQLEMLVFFNRVKGE